uniref:Uncharacterized protein n=1 Tax=Arundo donax TaxID=35708 RepID=A0A0A8Y3W4_ARUDO
MAFLSARTCATSASRRHRKCRDMARSASLVYTCAAPAPATASKDTSTALICSRYRR